MATKKGKGITHTWSIRQLVQLNDNSGTVIRVEYNVNSTDGEVSTQSNGSVELETTTIENFISYESLTEEMVLGWVREKLGENLGNHEVNNAAWIDSVVNPPAPRTINSALPW
jgi:hypothetical protein